jgi:hypothetical protein
MGTSQWERRNRSRVILISELRDRDADGGRCGYDLRSCHSRSYFTWAYTFGRNRKLLVAYCARPRPQKTKTCSITGPFSLPALLLLALAPRCSFPTPLHRAPNFYGGNYGRNGARTKCPATLYTGPASNSAITDLTRLLKNLTPFSRTQGCVALIGEAKAF